MRNRGVTLVELIVVISIVGILAIALGFSYFGWQGAYRAEKETKDLYTDLMSVRGMAMTQNRAYFVDFPTATSYRLSADTAALNDYTLVGDGLWDADLNGALDPVHTPLPTFPKTVEFTLSADGAGIPGTTFIFDSRGMINDNAGGMDAVPTRTICASTENNPDYDCIIISRTRITMGKLRTSIPDGGVCAAAPGGDCVAK